jgi:hypothetical protein
MFSLLAMRFSCRLLLLAICLLAACRAFPVVHFRTSTGVSYGIALRAEKNEQDSKRNSKNSTGDNNKMPLTELSRRQQASGDMNRLASPYLIGEVINKAAIVFIGVWFLLDFLGYGLVQDGTGLRIDRKEVAEMQRQINKTRPR